MLTEAQRERVASIAAEAMDLDADERERLLDSCDDAEVAAEVRELLGHEPSEGFLETPPGFAPHEGEPPQQEVGPYRLIERLGEGGFGVVWLAEQTSPIKRRVALKLIRPGMDSRQVLARFEAERQALALMSHPGVARVYDAGADERGPYIAMEYVPGAPISRFCNEQGLDVSDRARLMIQVCDAVQHAHTKGVIHRDLKPSNILVEVIDGAPVAKVIDFGVAKALTEPLTGATLFTEQGQLIGTPAYMPPEQARGAGLDLDTRADVYALGAVLYELLTGAPPIDPTTLRDRSVAGLLRVIEQSDPLKPSSRASGTASGDGPGGPVESAAERRRRLRGDLDWIVMMCLEKDRDRRYATAAELGADLKRFLAGEPVQAGPPSAVYRTRKFVQRNRALVAGAGAVAAALILGVVGAGWALAWALDERATAKEEAQKALAELGRANDTVAFIKEMLGSINPEDTPVLDVALLDRILSDAASRLEAGEIKDELTRGELHLVIGRAYLDMYLLERAAAPITAAAEIHERRLGGAAPRTLECIDELARLRVAQARYKDAESLCLRTLEVRRRTLGDEHPDTLQSLHSLARVYVGQLRWWEAVVTAEQVYELQHRTLGTEHPDTLRTMATLGAAYQGVNRLDESYAMHMRQLEIQTRLHGPDHPRSLHAMYGLALVAGQGTDPEVGVAATVEQTLEASRRQLGDAHLISVRTMNVLAGLHFRAGRLDEAESLYLENIELLKSWRGERHHDTLYSTWHLARLYREQDRLDLAERHYQTALSGLLETIGIEHPHTLAVAKEFLGLRRRTGAMDGVCAAAQHMRAKAVGGAPPRGAALLPDLIAECERTGVDLHDLRVYEAIVRAAEAAESNRNPTSLHRLSLRLLDVPIADLRDPVLALRVAERLSDLADAGRGAVGYRELHWLAELRQYTGDADAAVEIQRRALAVMPAADEWRHWARGRLVDVLLEAGRETEAAREAHDAAEEALQLALAGELGGARGLNSIAWSCRRSPMLRPHAIEWARAGLHAWIDAGADASPDALDVRDTLGVLLFESGDLKAAERVLRENLEIAARDGAVPDWRYELSYALVLAALGRGEDAEPLLRRAEQRAPYEGSLADQGYELDLIERARSAIERTGVADRTAP